MFLKLLTCVLLLQLCTAPPVTNNKKTEEDGDVDSLKDYIEYHRYIKEVVKALESDPAFKTKLENAHDSDIRSGKIATELELVSHHIRTRLDEIKRTELHRLKELAAKRDALMNNQLDSDDPLHHHIDHENPHTFEIEDLKRLIMKTTEDLAEADRKRREEFKEYELQKEYEKIEKLNHTSGDQREKLEHEYQQMEAKHKKHEKLHTPGHKQHLQEVWEEQDQMSQDFNPKTFFMLHDLDGNGLWDQDEVKALFVKELDKMYAAGAPEDDLRERIEEMERMREAVFQEIDMNRDGFIDYTEFLHQTKRNNFDKDPGWKGIDEQKPYTNEELEEYVRRHHEQQQYYQNMGAQGYPQYPNGQMPPGGYHPQQGYPQQGYPQQGHPQIHHPQQGYPQGHPQQGYPQGHPQQGYPQGHPPQGYSQEHPQQHHAQGQMPPHMQQHPGQGYPQGPGHPQAPQQHGQFHPGQLPQTQVHPQEIDQVPKQAALNTNEIHGNQRAPQIPDKQPGQHIPAGQQKQNRGSQEQNSHPQQAQQPPKQNSGNDGHIVPPVMPESGSDSVPKQAKVPVVPNIPPR